MARMPQSPGSQPAIKSDQEVQQALLEIAAKQSNLSKQDLRDRAKAAKKPKKIPLGSSKKWLERIKRSKKMRKPFQEESERFMRMYQGDYSERAEKRQRFEQMNVNIIYSHIEIITPAVFSGFPYIKIKPKFKAGMSEQDRTAAELKARSAQAVIHYWFRELATDEELHDVLFDSFYGHSGVELGWETEVFESNAPAGDDTDVENENAEENPESMGMKVVRDQPFIGRKDPWDFYFDPEARRRRDCRWIATREVIPYNFFVESAKFTEDAKKKVKPTIKPEYSENERNWSGRDDMSSEKEWVEIFTIWDKENFRKYVVNEKYEGFLNTEDAAGEEWPYELEYKDDIFPFCILDAKRDRKGPYTWSEFKSYEAQILALNHVRSAIHTHVKQTLPKYVAHPSAGERSKVSKLANAKSGEVVWLDNLEAVRPFQNAEVPKDLYNFNNMEKEDLLNVSGLFEYQNDSIADTATEASLIEGRSQVRKSMRSRQWEQFVCQIAGKLLQLCQQFMDKAVTVEIAGPQGTEWMDVDKNQIQGEFDVEIEAGIMEYKNESLRKQQLLKFVEITKDDPNVNRRKLLGKIAKEFDLDPEDVMLSDAEVQAMMPPPEPVVKFKPVDAESITDPTAQLSVIIAAMQQNGIPIPPQLMAALNSIQGPALAPAPPGADPGQAPAGPAAPGGKDLTDGGANPNGNQTLPPVAGNIPEQNGGIV